MSIRNFQEPVMFYPSTTTTVTQTGMTLEKNGGKSMHPTFDLGPVFTQMDECCMRQNPQNLPLKWRTKNRTETAKGGKRTTVHVCEWTFAEIAGYIVVLARVKNTVGISYCAPSDIGAVYNPEQSIVMATGRLQLKFQKDWTVEQYIRLAMDISGYPVPGKIAKLLKRTLEVKVVVRPNGRTRQHQQEMLDKTRRR